MWSHFHHKSLWHSSPPSPVVSLQTPYQRKEKTSYRCCLSLLSHQHTSPHHPLSSTHVYVSWTHITIHHSKLTTHWVVLRGLVEKTIVRPFSPGGSVQFSFLLWIPITLGQARFQALEVWNIFGNFVTDFFSPFLNLWTSFQEFPWQHRSGQGAGFAGIREAGYQVVHCCTRTENGTSGAQIKILRPLFITNTPPKTPI